MSVRVVDASALGALAFGEPEAERVVRMLGHESLKAPALLWFEMASICRKKIRQHPDMEDELLDGLKRAACLPIQIVEVAHTEVVRVSGKAGISTYDANYLWLARHLRAELVTLDQPLREAASRYGVHAL
jgi:predicted nucleic acid-binding protein